MWTIQCRIVHWIQQGEVIWGRTLGGGTSSTTSWYWRQLWEVTRENRGACRKVRYWAWGRGSRMRWWRSGVQLLLSGSWPITCWVLATACCSGWEVRVRNHKLSTATGVTANPLSGDVCYWQGVVLPIFISGKWTIWWWGLDAEWPLMVLHGPLLLQCLLLSLLQWRWWFWNIHNCYFQVGAYHCPSIYNGEWGYTIGLVSWSYRIPCINMRRNNTCNTAYAYCRFTRIRNP